MTRFMLTLKQHRFEIIGTIAVCLGLAALALYQSWQLNSIVFPAGCKPDQSGIPSFDANGQPIFNVPTRACQDAIDRFNSISNGTLSYLTSGGAILAPFFLAVLLGAPVVAREIEQNTAPLSWSLIGSRRRWLLARVGALLLVFVPSMLVLGLAGDALYAARNPGISAWASFGDYSLRGIPVLFWSLAAFVGSVSLGALFGRTMPAVFVALVVCLFARVGGEYYFQRIVLEPYAQPLMTREQMSSAYGYTYNSTDLTVGWRFYLDGKPFEGDPNLWYATHTPPPELTQPKYVEVTPAPSPDPSASPGATADPNATPNPILDQVNVAPVVWGPQSIPYGFHGDRYWPVVAAEAGCLTAGSLLLASIAFFWVGRRRPY